VPVYLYIEAYGTDGTVLKHCEEITEMRTPYWYIDDFYETFEASYERLRKRVRITVHYYDGEEFVIDFNIDITPQQMNGETPPEGCWGIHDQYVSSQ
jgi:hypothetical protein